MDWASDVVLRDFLNLVEMCDIKATLQVTHDTQMLGDLLKNENIDCGIHPNFNNALMGIDGSENLDGVLGKLKELIPSAVCSRSHALTYSSVIGRMYEKYGIRYDLNNYIPVDDGWTIYPYTAPLGNFTVIPFIFEDDLYLFQNKRKSIDYYLGDAFDAPRVFNFHPIHLFLNTDKIETYVRARPYFRNDSALCKMKNTTFYGVRDMFLEMVDMVKKDGWKSEFVKDGKWEMLNAELRGERR